MMNLLILTSIIVFIIDLSGLIETIEKKLSKWLKIKSHIPKPWSCSLCLSWWCGLIYLIIIHQFTIPMIGYVAFLSFMTNPIYNLLLFIRDLCNGIINKLYNTLE